ncbi:MAG: chemotaxis protein CheW [Sideroxydans sp.]|nr:chemotaxis protein CheW [Sideroxydans sp.]
MSIDLSQFYQVFFEEAAEHLASMESLLLGVDMSDPSDDDLNAVFRAAHSIKGGAGTFGFNDMVDVTHVLENLLDKIRKHEIRLTEEMVNVFLEAGDVLHMQLTAHRGEGKVEPTEVAAVCEKLAELNTRKQSAPECVLAAVPVETESAYGFFDDEPAASQAPTEEAFGFFDDEPTPAARATADDDAYGFFGDEPVVQDAHTTEVVVETPKGYGFLVEESTLPAQQEIAKQERRQGYGFLVDTATLPAQQTAHADDAHHDDEHHHPTRRATDVADEPVRVGRRASDRAPTPAAADTSIRVNVEKVDQLINLVGELVITQAMLAQSASEMDGDLVEKLMSGLHQLERNTRDLQEVVMSVRMLPISFVFSRFPRVVRDLAAKLNKQVDLKTIGENTELDKGLIEKIADPLTHLVRNSLDHGVESPEKRVAAGKNAKGTITLAASHQGGNVVIEVSDDGAGLNRSRILSKAMERGLPVREDISDQEVWMLIFEPGFSTAEVVTDVSGRGVGMDVVKRNIAALGGRIELNSVEGLGTRTTIRLPLTLAILDGLSVDVGGETYIIPLTNIIESLLIGDADLRTVSGQGQMIHVRGEYLPLVSMRGLFNLPEKAYAASGRIVVIVEAEGRKVALSVDDLLGQHQVVIKSLESNFRKLPGISGATIMGNGKVALILDVSVLSLTPSQQNRLAA